MLALYVKSIDASSLNRAVAMALQVTTQEPRNLVLNVGLGIASRARELTPFVEQQTIDTELGVISTPVLSTRGKRKGLPLKSGRQSIEVPDQSAAMKIVLARMWSGSDYNQLTRQRWAIDRMQFSPGEGKAGFWAKVAETAKRMVAARHSSTHFLQAGWGAAYKALTRLRYGGAPLVQDAAIDVAATVVPGEFDAFGSAKLYGGGSNVSLLLENNIGMTGVNAETYNEALHEHSSGPTQQAVDEKADEMQTRYLPRWEAELAKRWNAID